MLKNLLSIQLRSLISGMGIKSKNGKAAGKGRVLLLAVLISLLGACFAMFSFSMAIMLAEPMIISGLDWLYFGLFTVAAFSLVFIFSIFETKSELFDSKDNELLLSMPVRTRDIILSRVFSILLLNYLECFIVMLPATVVYAIFRGSALGVFGSLLVSLIIPLLATSFASGFGYLVTLLAKRFSKNSFVTVAMSLGFIAIYFFAYGSLMTGLESIEADPESFVLGLEQSLGWLRYIGLASMLEPLPFLIFTAISVFVTAIAYAVISKNYIRIITGTYRSAKKKYNTGELKVGSARLALVRKEFARFFSSSAYMLNSSIGIIFQVMLGAVMLIKKADIAAVYPVLYELGIDGEALLPVLVTMAMVTIASTNTISASALSLEGNNLWIMKSLPITPFDIIMSKLAPHLCLTLPSSLICSILAGVALGVDGIMWVFVILTPLAATALFAMFGLLVNILLPKFDYVNEAQVVKQSLAMCIVMFGAMIYSIIMLGAGAALSLILGSIVSLSIVTSFIIFTLALVFFVLTGPVARKLGNI